MNKSLESNVAKLLSSRVATQAISFVTAPIIARLYLPEYFGIRQIFMSLSSLIIVVSCLRYELSIPLGKDKREAITGFVLSLIFTSFFSLLSLVLVLFLRKKIALWFKTPELSNFLWLFPIVVFLGGLGMALRYYASREGKFSTIAWVDFSVAFSSNIIILTWALIFGSSAVGLFFGYIAGIVFGILLFFIFLIRKLLYDIKNADLNINAILTTLKIHRKFPIFETWSGLLGSISPQLPVIIFGLYYSSTIVGYYSFGYRIVLLPMTLLGSSISEVFFPTAAKHYNEAGNLSSLVSTMYKRLVQLSVFPMVGFGFLGASLFGFMFGEKWVEAGIYAQILSGFVLMNTISSPLGSTIIILKKQEMALFFNVIVTVIRVITLLLGAQTGQPRMALALLVIFNIIAISSVLVWVLNRSGVSIGWSVKIFFKYLMISSLLLLPAGCLAWFSSNIFMVLLTSGGAALVYLFGLFWFEPGFRDYKFNALITRLFAQWNKKKPSP